MSFAVATFLLVHLGVTKLKADKWWLLASNGYWTYFKNWWRLCDVGVFSLCVTSKFLGKFLHFTMQTRLICFFILSFPSKGETFVKISKGDNMCMSNLYVWLKRNFPREFYVPWLTIDVVMLLNSFLLILQILLFTATAYHTMYRKGVPGNAFGLYNYQSNISLII